MDLQTAVGQNLHHERDIEFQRHCRVDILLIISSTGSGSSACIKNVQVCCIFCVVVYAYGQDFNCNIQLLEFL